MLRTDRLRGMVGDESLLNRGEDSARRLAIFARASAERGAWAGELLAATSRANMGCRPHGLMMVPLDKRCESKRAASQGWRRQAVTCVLYGGQLAGVKSTPRGR